VFSFLTIHLWILWKQLLCSLKCNDTLPKILCGPDDSYNVELIDLIHRVIVEVLQLCLKKMTTMRKLTIANYIITSCKKKHLKM